MAVSRILVTKRRPLPRENDNKVKEVKMKCKRTLARLVMGLLSVAMLYSGAARAGNPFSTFINELGSKLNQQNQAGQPTTRPAAAPAAPAQQLPSARLKKASNIRSGPGTSNPVVVLAPQGSVVAVHSTSGSWSEVSLNVSGIAYQGWIYTPLLDTSAAVAPPAGGVPAAGTAAAGRSIQNENIQYAGYSDRYQAVKGMVRQGHIDEAAKYYDKQTRELHQLTGDEKDFPEKYGFLAWLEEGTLALDEGDYNEAVKSFTHAENILDARDRESKISDFFSGITTFTAETVSGNEELKPYAGEGYERVLMLNYKSIGYLLQGKRQAYNVTRRAIDWQNLEKKAFDERLRETQEQLAEKQQQAKGDGNGNDSLNSKAYAAYDRKASTVPNAFVNPFGYYVAGMIQEFESYQDRSLRDNARISYEKALELNPGSAVLKQAVKDLGKPAPQHKRLLHVVVADGYAPEKKMLTYAISADTMSIPIKLPIYEPVASQVARIEVRTTGGNRLATLSPVADVEALSLRHQKDSEPFRQLRVLTAFLTSTVTHAALNNGLGRLGEMLASKKDEMAAPDMRSWMSLPASIQAARLQISKGISRIKLVSYDKRGRQLASSIAEIDPNSHAVVYARSLDNVMYSKGSDKLWLADL